MKKILVVYYTQTGQLKDIVDSLMSGIITDADVKVTYEELKPKPAFPFPWTSDQFFQAMPESVKGIPCELEPLKVNEDENFDLIIVAWQPWFLSPSIPVHAFFRTESVKRLLNGRPVITVVGSRNMWVMAQNTINSYIKECGGRHVGNILLFDRAANLLSVISIIRWMFKGKKDRYLKIIPPAGVSDVDIANASKYGPLIHESVKTGNYDRLHPDLLAMGAVDVDPSVVMIEKRGIIFFRIWASFILKKGSYGEKSRLLRVRLFKYYLLTVLYLVSPFASVLYQVIKPFRKGIIKKQISLYQSL